MRRVAHGAVWFPPEAERRVLELMKLQCSATRSAYQGIQKHGLSGNAVKKYVKRNYMADLNQRYIADACAAASGITHPSALFGGKRAWKALQTSTISKVEWGQRRNSRLYSRGDRTKGGNPNIRISGETILVNDPAQWGQWLAGSVYLPKKWSPDWSCYDARLLYRDGKFRLVLSWIEATPPIVTDRAKGIIGVDTNPDGLGVACLNSEGNLLSHRYETLQRIQFASEGRRDNDIRLAAKALVEKARSQQTPVALEKLNFAKKRGGSKKFRRMKSNFLHRKLIEAVTARALKEGVEVIEVHPAFSSILGNLKYTKMYALNRHTAAALVIGRRGLGFRERQDFTVTPEDESGGRLTLEGRGHSQTLSQKACSWLMNRFVRQSKPADLTGPDPAPGWKPGIGSSAGEIPVGESSTTTGRRGQRQHVVRR